jgi:RNA-directed DNA polymerase
MADGVFRETVTSTPQGGVISPLLSNIYLHGVDRAFTARGIGELVHYAEDFVVLACSEREARAALDTARVILADLGLMLRPDKTKVVDLRDGREGFDVLGWHFRARVSGRLLERRVRRYYLHRWPSQRAMKRIREKVKAKTGRNRVGVTDLRVVIDELTPILRGWGNYFRTCNAAIKFRQIGRYVAWRLKRLLIKRKGRKLRAGEADAWTADWLVGLGVHRLRGTILYPGTA